jgi:hypothetical protein
VLTNLTLITSVMLSAMSSRCNLSRTDKGFSGKAKI